MDKISTILILGVIIYWVVAAVALIPAYAHHDEWSISADTVFVNEPVTITGVVEHYKSSSPLYLNATLYKDGEFLQQLDLYSKCCGEAHEHTGMVPYDQINWSFEMEEPGLYTLDKRYGPPAPRASGFNVEVSWQVTETNVEPEPIPEAEEFWICHNGDEIMVGASEVDTHVINHGDTPGMCPIVVPLPTNSTSPIYNGITSLPDPDYSAVVEPIVVPQYMDVCHSNELIQVNVDNVRYHLAHGDKQFECPKKGAVMFVDTIDIEQLTKAELVSMITRILTELMSR